MFKQIDEYDRYKIDINGTVIFTRNNWKTHKVLTPCISIKDGYKFVRLTNDEGKRKSCNLHRLLARHFIPNPLNLPVVDHIDKNKLNNKLSNLRWSTKSNNRFNAESFKDNTFSIGKRKNKKSNTEGFAVYVSLGLDEKRLYIGYSPDINIAIKMRDDFYKDRIKNNLNVPQAIVDYYSIH